MNTARRLIEGGLVLSALLTMLGCDPESGGLEIDEVEEGSFRNGGGVWIGNGLVHPNVTGVSPSYGLSTAQGLPADGVLMSTASGVLAATYMVECALAPGQSITKVRPSDGQSFTMHGVVGLAPEWRDGQCKTHCQQWITACLLARTNASGESVPVFLSADHSAIGFGSSAAYPNYEGSFYGNVFQDSSSKHLCRSHDPSLWPEDEAPNSRTCGGLSPEDCGVNDWGFCDVDDRCAVQDDGSDPEFVHCSAGSPASGTHYRTISVFLE